MMKIVLNGYGRMGKVIERIAKDRGHDIVYIITKENAAITTKDVLQNLHADVAIDFSLPSIAPSFIQLSFLSNIPVVSGTTAWLDQWDDTLHKMAKHGGTLLHASNFSLGVNLFFELNERFAKTMNAYPSYKPSIHEVHHTGKIDAPSGTAITLSEKLIAQLDTKTKWVYDDPKENEIKISSERSDPAPGTHHVKYQSAIDEIELIHTAKSRDGFALGAVIAAEYLKGKVGLHTMKDVLNTSI